VRVLFLGGAGMIGSAAAAEVVRQGHELTIVTRGEARRQLPAGVRHLRCDVYHVSGLSAALAATRSAGPSDERYDAVVNWVGYTPAQLTGHAELFSGLAGQYVFISTCSVFARPVPSLPVTESSPRRQPTFGYARDKLACEEFLTAAYRADGFPLTIVRPAHVYDRTVVPVLAGWNAIERMRAGQPVIVHGDGTSLWTLMHSDDFARAIAALLGNGQAIGESVNVVSGDILTWDQIHLILATAAGVTRPVLAHRSSESIARELPGWADVLEHDFRHSMLFDNMKLRRLAPGFVPLVSFSAGAREIMAYHDGDAGRRGVSEDLDAAFDRLLGEDHRQSAKGSTS
jgi:nucleoside-diphosphate-sugar epimerase